MAIIYHLCYATNANLQFLAFYQLLIGINSVRNRCNSRKVKQLIIGIIYIEITNKSL